MDQSIDDSGNVSFTALASLQEARRVKAVSYSLSGGTSFCARGQAGSDTKIEYKFSDCRNGKAAVQLYATPTSCAL